MERDAREKLSDVGGIFMLSVDDGFSGNIHISSISTGTSVFVKNFIRRSFRMPYPIDIRTQCMAMSTIQIGNEVVKRTSERMFVFVISKEFIAYAPHFLEVESHKRM